MGDLEQLAAHRKIPVFVFLENNLVDGSSEILFLTIDIPSLFECIRHYMKLMSDSVKQKRCVSFSFETRMYTPIEINKIATQIDEKKRQKMKQPTPKPLPAPETKKPTILTLIKGSEDSNL
jgi:hypothetical protein